MKSPRGRYRMWQMLIPFVLGVLWLSQLGVGAAGDLPPWLIFLPSFVAKMGVAIPSVYYVSRLFNLRTHELDSRAEMARRGHAQFIGICIVTAACLFLR